MNKDVEYYAMDRARNSTPRRKFPVVKDTEPPVITYTVENGYIADDGTIVLGVEGKIIFKITDNYMLDKFYYRINGEEWRSVQLSGKEATVTITV